MKRTLKNTFRTLVVIVVLGLFATLLLAVAELLLAVANVLNNCLVWLTEVDVLCWEFFGAGIVVAVIASAIASVMGKHRQKKQYAKQEYPSIPKKKQ